MTKDDALKLLGLTPSAARISVMAAWRAAVKAGHADRGGAADIAKLTEARDILLKQRDFACPACGGAGIVSVMGVSRPCKRCEELA